MKLMPEKLPIADCRLPIEGQSQFSIRHFAQATWRRVAFGGYSNHSQSQQAPIGRRSPGRKALFSSVHPAPASWTASAGFTLIEVLLALMICAVVLVIISSVFASALKLQERASASVDKSLPIERALNVMRKDLKNAVAPGGILAGPLQSGADTSASIQIYSTTGLMMPNQPWSEIQKITYGLQTPNDSSSNGKDLVRSVTRNLLSTSTDDEDDQFLASGVETLNFYYFDGANWLDSWDDTTQTNLPQAVRVNLQLAAANQNEVRPEPIQLVVPLMVQVHTNQLDNTDDGSTNNATGEVP
jgi:type II secretion system protein J